MATRSLWLATAAVAIAATILPATTGEATTGQADTKIAVVPASIDATGANDVTDELNSFLSFLSDGTTVRFPAEGRFRIEGTVRIDEKDRMVIEGNGATLFSKSQGGLKRRHLEVTGGTNLTISRLTIAGSHPEGGLGDNAYQAKLEGQHGISILGTSGVNIDDVTITDVYGDFIYLGRSDDGRWARRIWIHDSTLTRNGRQGIAIVAGQDVVIERNDISQVARSTIDLEPNAPSGGAINIHVLRNEVGPGRLLFLAASGRGPVGSVVISANRLTGRALSATILPPPGERGNRFWITGNRGGGLSAPTPIKVNRVDGLVVWRNRQPVRQGQVGVRASEVCGLNVTENDFGQLAAPTEEAGPTCAFDLGLVPPDPPAVFGRPQAPEPATVVPDSTPEEEPDDGPAGVIGTTEERPNWGITITLGVLAAILLGAAIVTSARRPGRR